ncbi:MAG: ATP synthase F1 subunit delta [Anditalea sp.]
MSVIRVASRYAKSLLELSVEKGELEAVHQDMIKLLKMGRSNRDLTVMLQSPVIESEKKLNVLKALFAKDVSPLTITYFNVLSQKGRENVLLASAKEFHKLYNIHKGIQEAEIVTTFPIDEELRKSFIGIVKEISGKGSVELIEKTEKDLIGGFVLTIGDRQIDESLNSKLKMLQLKFTQNLYEKKY